MSIVVATVESTDQKMGYRGQVRDHQPLVLDYARPYGNDEGYGPMELLLVALGGCTASGVGLLLRKKGRTVTGIKAVVTGDRAETHPTVFSSIDLVLEVSSPDATHDELNAVLAAAETSICPVYIMVARSTPIRATARLAVSTPAS